MESEVCLELYAFENMSVKCSLLSGFTLLVVNYFQKTLKNFKS